MGSNIKPLISVTDAYRYPIPVPWFFTTAGASNPAVAGQSANISTVTREQTAGAEEFFRVTLDEGWDQVCVVVSVEVAEGTFLNAEPGLDYVPSGGSARNARTQIDVVVANSAGTPTNNLSARKICGILWVDQGTL